MKATPRVLIHGGFRSIGTWLLLLPGWWAIALAASANGQKKMEEFNRKYGRRIIWVPWQRPGFELALMLKRAVDATPGCDGLILGGHGLFTRESESEEAA